jgi:hypothetical protein
MASDKRPKKAKKSKYATKSGEFRHTDGDRRHRGGPSADQATRDKTIRQSFDGIPVDDPPASG